MPSLYAHPKLYDRLKDKGVVDRFVRGIDATYEQVVAVYPASTPEGLVVHVMSVQMVQDGRQSIVESPLALYPFAQLSACEADARLVASKLDLSFRRADPLVGWQTVYDPDHPAVAVTSEDVDFQV